MRWHFLALACIVLTSCTSNNPVQPQPAVPAEYTLVGTSNNGDVAVNLYADTNLYAGYNNVYVKVTVKGQLLNGFVSLGTTMKMGTMSHGCPIIQPGQQVDSAGFYKGAIVFTMAGTDQEWKVMVTVSDNSSGSTTTLDLPVTVTSSSWVKVVKSNNSKTIVALLPKPWRVGKNDIEFAIFTGTDPTYLPPSQATITMVPTMPSMGHGSYGNVNPTLQSNSLYKGVVNYSMSGDWQIDLSVQDNGTTPVTATYTVNVPR